MSGGDEFLAGLLRALGDLFDPLRRAGEDGDALRALAAATGWRLEPGTIAAPAAITSIAGKVGDLAGLADDLASSDDTTASTAQSQALDDVSAIAVALGQLAAAGGGGGALGADFTAMFADPRLAEKLVSLLVYDYLGGHRPQVFALARLVGLLDEVRRRPGPAPASSRRTTSSAGWPSRGSRPPSPTPRSSPRRSSAGALPTTGPARCSGCSRCWGGASASR